MIREFAEMHSTYSMIFSCAISNCPWHVDTICARNSKSLKNKGAYSIPKTGRAQKFKPWAGNGLQHSMALQAPALGLPKTPCAVSAILGSNNLDSDRGLPSGLLASISFSEGKE